MLNFDQPGCVLEQRPSPLCSLWNVIAAAGDRSSHWPLTFVFVFCLLTYHLLCCRLRQRAHGMVVKVWQRSSVLMGSSTCSPSSVDTSPQSWWLVRRWASGLWTPDMKRRLSLLPMLWQGFQVQTNDKTHTGDSLCSVAVKCGWSVFVVKIRPLTFDCVLLDGVCAFWLLS